MHDLTIAPPYQPIVAPPIPKADKTLLANGIPLHWVNSGSQDVIRIECLFPADSWKAPHPKISFFGTKMLLEGTGQKSAAEINRILDLYGAFTEIAHTPDYYGIVVYTMPKFLPEILPVLAEVLENAAFPEKEWLHLKNIALQQLKVNREQSSWLAGARFKAMLFGQNSRYGYAQNEADLHDLRREEAREFYLSHILEQPFFIFASGKVEDDSLALIAQNLGVQPKKQRSFPGNTLPPAAHPTETGRVAVPKNDSSQYTVRLGKKAPGRNHPDYFKALVANEILGGYFGSRLMKNIREEKGMTYGISSYLPALKDSAYFMIATDINKNSLDQLKDEIGKELQLLRSEKVSEAELERVKNVMAGDFARSLSTAFEIGDLYQTTILCDLSPTFYHTYLENIRAVTAAEVQETAQSLFDMENMAEVIVG